jgi:hypothetical protein
LSFTLARLHELEVFSLESGNVQSIGPLPPGCAFILSWAKAPDKELMGNEAAVAQVTAA